MFTLMILLIVLSTMATVVGCLWLEWQCNRLSGLPRFNRVEAVVYHTYALDRGTGAMDARGLVSAVAAGEQALKHGVLLIIVCGYASRQSRPDCQIYADFIMRHFARSDIEIILGEDEGVRTTCQEVTEAKRIIDQRGFQVVLAVASFPHLARVAGWWGKLAPGYNVRFYGAYVPWRYHAFELAMIIGERLLPPGTKRRDLALRLMGRHR